MGSLPSRILVGLDGSAAALEAADYALALALRLGAKVTFVAVVDEQVVADMDRFGLIKRESARTVLEREMRHYTDEASAHARQMGVECDELVELGDVVRTLVDVAVSGGYDLLVVASRSMRSLERLAAGQVTARLVDFSPIPILVYKSTSRDVLGGVS
ncbi:MAG: universal stress protein [Thermoprotei archaeon]